MSETYKVLTNHPDYEISDKGNVRSRKYTKIFEDGFTIEVPEMLLEYYMTNRHMVCYIDGKQEQIHRLVAETFIPNPNFYRFVLHKDGNRINNSVDNLEWSESSVRNRGSRDIKIGYPIYCIELDVHYRSIADCADKLDISYDRLYRALLAHKELDGLNFVFD